MNWQNLKQNKCPKCDKPFGYFAFTEPGFIKCPVPKCEFRISEKRYSEIVNSQINAQLEEKWNQEQEDLL